MTPVPTPRPEQVEAAAREATLVNAILGALPLPGSNHLTSLGVALVAEAVEGSDWLTARDERLRREGARQVVEVVSALPDEWESHARLFVSPENLRTRQDWEYVARTLRAALAPFTAILDAPPTAEGETPDLMAALQESIALHRHRTAEGER